MNLFFVYDTSYCKADEDDPRDAIIYFFPTQANDSERYLLCCQLVGVAKFLKVTFTVPSVIALEHGKFAFLWSGKYLMVLGAHSEVESSAICSQLSFLCGIFCFYHGSLNEFLKACKNDRQEFLAKLELSWSRYITLSQCFGSVLPFSMNALPLKAFKKSSGIVSKANRLLHMCQLSCSVMAGVIFYNSRVLASQLTSQLTNYLSLMSNYNASSPVGNVFSTINLPPDVQLKHVYLSSQMISKILKFNHTSAGCSVRIKNDCKSFPKSCSLPIHQEYLSSGSEGDIDSGNCSESVFSVDSRIQKKFRYPTKRTKEIYFASNMKDLLNGSSSAGHCCEVHWKLSKKKLIKSRNKRCLEYVCKTHHKIDTLDIPETEDSGIHPKINEKKDSLYDIICHHKCFNLLCHHHINLLSSDCVSQLRRKNSNVKSTSDLEFSCSFCFENDQTVNPVSLKHWNSEPDLTISKSFKHHKRNYLNSSESDFIFLERKKHEYPKKNKIQVLKCRTGSDAFGADKLKGNKLLSWPLHRKQTSSRNSDSSSCRTSNTSSVACDKYSEIESNDLQKYVLYVQRYGGSTLLLLLNKGYSEKIITYLWNCGFSILRDIEYSAEKISNDTSYDIDPSFYMMLYNSSKKVLKEYPHYPSVMLTEKRTRDSVQTIQAEFQRDSNIQNFNLLSAYQSIYASHKDSLCAFYVQPECNTRKIETLSQISKRAVRRMEKFFKINL